MSHLARLIKERLDIIVDKTTSLISGQGPYAQRPIEEIRGNVRTIIEGILAVVEDGDETTFQKSLTRIAQMRASLNFNICDVQRALITCRDVAFAESESMIKDPEARLALLRELISYHDMAMCQYSDIDQRFRAEMIRSEAEKQTRTAEEGKLEKVNVIGRMAAKVAHDIRNPICLIGLNLELLEDELRTFEKEGEVDVTEAMDLIRAIREVLDRLSRFTDEYTQIARLPKMVLGLHDINTFLEGQILLVEKEIQERGIEVRSQLDWEIPNILIDEDHLGRAIGDILRNSIDAMPNGGTLFLGTKRENGEVVITIADTGTGIDHHEWDEISIPADVIKQGNGKIGLQLVEQVILEHGGSISLTGTVGRGTKFTIRLPISKGG